MLQTTFHTAIATELIGNDFDADGCRLVSCFRYRAPSNADQEEEEGQEGKFYIIQGTKIPLRVPHSNG
jgi:hypothetical protein